MLVWCGCLDTVVVTCGNLKLSHCNDHMHAPDWLALIWFRCFQKYLSANHFPPSRSQLQNLFSPGWPVERYESMRDEDVTIATAYVKQVECVNNAPWVTCPPRLYRLLEIWIDSKRSCIFAAALRFLFFYQTGRIFRKLECWLRGERANIFTSFYQKIHVSGVINNKIPRTHCKEPFICLSRIHDGVYTCLPPAKAVRKGCKKDFWWLAALTVTVFAVGAVVGERGHAGSAWKPWEVARLYASNGIWDPEIPYDSYCPSERRYR